MTIPVVAGDGQDIANAAAFQLGAQARVGAVDFVAGDPAGWGAGVQGVRVSIARSMNACPAPVA